MITLERNQHFLAPTDTDYLDEFWGFSEIIQALLKNKKRQPVIAHAYFDNIENEGEHALPVAEASAIVSPPRAYGGGWAIVGHQSINVRLPQSRDRDVQLQRKILDLLERAGKENWDGEGARAISEETANIAQKIVIEFPSGIEEPDISASPRGDIDFDWVAKEDVMLTISVVSSGKIVFALMLGDLHLSGTEPWKGNLPEFLDCCFEHLRRAQIYDRTE